MGVRKIIDSRVEKYTEIHLLNRPVKSSGPEAAIREQQLTMKVVMYTEIMSLAHHLKSKASSLSSDATGAGHSSAMPWIKL